MKEGMKLMNHMKSLTKNPMINLPIKKGVIIGSYALGTRYAKDIDIICYEKDILCDNKKKDDYQCSFVFESRNVECLLANNQESLQQIYNFYKEGISIASKHTLFCIKAGHIIYPHKQWEKHIQDYHVLRPQVVVTEISSYTKEFIALHRKCTKERMGSKGTPKLVGVSKQDFFDNKVIKYYVHDNVHRSIAHKDRPMYEFMQENINSVECSKSLWDKFTYEDKVMCVLEEAYTIALERKIIPLMKGNPGIIWSPFDAFKWALMRICTTLCSGWYRQFSIDNYFTILNAYGPGYINKFEQNISKYE